MMADKTYLQKRVLNASRGPAVGGCTSRMQWTHIELERRLVSTLEPMK
jgi:tRNA U34 5-carboxymethylaminomethyl modifying enzyme MnmG/GidA